MNVETYFKKVFVKETQYGKMYSTNISNKRKDGSWRTSYISLYFPDDAEIIDGEEYKLKGYLVSTNDPNKVALRVIEFEKNTKSVESIKQEDIIVEDDDLPF